MSALPFAPLTGIELLDRGDRAARVVADGALWQRRTGGTYPADRLDVDELNAYSELRAAFDAREVGA